MMNFSVHMDEATLSELNRVAKEEGKSRSALLSEAFKLYVDERNEHTQTKGWPKVLVDHWNSVAAESFLDHPDFGNTDDLKPLHDPAL
jgi:metal-responsive CopG/Arc/MetJ family transcriptional regulator